VTDRGVARPQPDLPQRSVGRAVARPGTALDQPLRDEFGARFARDLTTVRVHTDPDAAATAVGLGAAAYAVGRHVVFAPGRFNPGTADGRRLLTHELAHVGAAPDVDDLRLGRPGDAAERAADHAADHILAGRVAPPAQAAPGIHRQAVADPFAVIDAGPLTPVTAKGLLDHYATLTDPERDAVVRAHHKVGVLGSGLTRWLAALGRADVTAYRDLIRDLQERVQRIAVQQLTGRTHAQLGAMQGAFMRASAERRATATAAEEAKTTHAPPRPVTATDVAREHQKEVVRTSPITATVTNPWDALPADQQASWNARAAAVIAKIVDACQRMAPELHITAANLKWNPHEVAAKGTNVYAFSGDPISFGMRFVETAEADAEYVVSTVVHEIAGHPDFGPRTSSYEAQIYAEAHVQEPTLGSPWDTRQEVTTYGYIGTEIYAALREVPHHKALSKDDAAKGLTRGIDPSANIDNKIWLVKEKYAPAMAAAIVQGLYERFRIDPRISQDALALFEQVAERYFPKTLKGVPHRGAYFDVVPRVELGVEWAGGRTRPRGGVSLNIAARWANTALSAGLRLDVPLTDRDTFLRVGLQGELQQRLFGSLYLQLHGGVTGGLTPGASSGLTGGAGLNLRLGKTELGVVYDYLHAASNDPDAHRAFVTLGLRL
jgi:hypothetical protein